MNNITTSPEGQKLLGEGGQIALSGEGCTQLDNTQKAYDSFPLMVGLMMTLVLIVIGAAFRSIVAPVRAVLCLLWMLAITFGFAIAVIAFFFIITAARHCGNLHWINMMHSVAALKRTAAWLLFDTFLEPTLSLNRVNTSF